MLQNHDPGGSPGKLEAFARAQFRRGQVGGTTTIPLEMPPHQARVLQQIGFLDENFGMGHWEDNDYARRAQARAPCVRFWILSVAACFRLVQALGAVARGGPKKREALLSEVGETAAPDLSRSRTDRLRRARFQQILQTDSPLARKDAKSI